MAAKLTLKPAEPWQAKHEAHALSWSCIKAAKRAPKATELKRGKPFKNGGIARTKMEEIFHQDPKETIPIYATHS